ncbi:zinc transporter ZIP13-like isoform X2 [Glandiceps talaboti]
MGPLNKILVVSLGLVVFGCTVLGEIHRAKHTGKVVSQEDYLDHDGSAVNKFESANSRLEVWLCTLMATSLVGLSGIFPLLVIRVQDNPGKTEEGTSSLRLLLSFAVGGLLGDVFLHLLPEAFANSDTEDDHGQHITTGLWVVVGILSFLILEKIFTDENTDDSETESTTKNAEHSHQTLLSSDSPTVKTSNLRERHHHHSNGVEKKKQSANGTAIRNGQANGHVKQNGSLHSVNNSKPEIKCTEERPEKIKITGYLNLLANFIDNFTHGLAVAASFLISTKMGLLTTAAIMLHEIPHEIGDFAILLKSGFNRWDAAKAQVTTATGGMIGAIVTLLAESAKGAGDSTAWVLPFTSGGFIYIALVTVVPDLLKETNPVESIKQVVCMCSGVAIMGLVTLIVD